MENRGYGGSKPSPKYWADNLEGDTKFAEDFKGAFNYDDITEANGFTQEILEGTDMTMDIALTRYG